MQFIEVEMRAFRRQSTATRVECLRVCKWVSELGGRGELFSISRRRYISFETSRKKGGAGLVRDGQQESESLTVSAWYISRMHSISGSSTGMCINTAYLCKQSADS
jgi:hypothetical protein